MGLNGLWELCEESKIYVFSLHVHVYLSCRSKVPVRQNVRSQHGKRTEAQTWNIVRTTFPGNSTTQSQDFMDGIWYFKHYIYIFKNKYELYTKSSSKKTFHVPFLNLRVVHTKHSINWKVLIKHCYIYFFFQECWQQYYIFIVLFLIIYLLKFGYMFFFVEITVHNIFTSMNKFNFMNFTLCVNLSFHQIKGI